MSADSSSSVMAPWRPESEHHDQDNGGIPDAVFVKIIIATYVSFFIFVFLGGFINHYRNNNGSSSGPSILKSLPPVIVYSAESNANVVEDCAVCLSEFEDGDKCLVLPNCKHCFHSGCIQMWFSNHSTCPLCRRSAVHQQPKVTTDRSALHPTASSIQTTTTSEEEPVVDVRIDVPVVNQTEPSCVPRDSDHDSS